MVQCSCAKSNGSQCTRDASIKTGDNLQFCWQHQKCKQLVVSSQKAKTQDGDGQVKSKTQPKSKQVKTKKQIKAKPYQDMEATARADQFYDRLTEIIKAHLEFIKETGQDINIEKVTEKYAGKVFVETMEDPDHYSSMDGNPKDWENDWIREFIEEHSDFYNKYGIEDET